jgi:hypothetical protein
MRPSIGRNDPEAVIRLDQLIHRLRRHHDLTDEAVAHRLRHRAHSQIRVDGRGERAAQLDAFAPHRAEAGQRERHRVGAGPQVDDLVLPGAIGDDRSRLLDQRGTGRVNGHARQHGAGRIADAAGNRPLRLGG